MNKDTIISNYNNYDEDKRAFGLRSERIEFTYTQKLLDKFIKPNWDAEPVTMVYI